jgi:transglutaminase-like putative cysteine protease
MSLARAFSLSSILLAAAAFAGLALAADLSPWMLSLGWAALGLCLAQAMVDSPRTPWLFTLRLSPVAWNILLVVAFIGFWIDLFWISQELLPAGIHFLIALIVNKLFNLHQRRDFLHLYAVSLMAILASAAMTVHIWYAPLLMAYLFAGVWTLLLYHLTKEREDSTAREECSVSGSAQEIGWITAPFFWTTNAMAAAALCLTISIFFVIPRVGFGLLQKGQGESLRISGFTEKVDLGVMGSVKQDPSIVMRVELPEGRSQPHEPLYLRGMAYDRYTGKSWSNSLLNRRNLTERPQGLFTVRANHGRAFGDPAPQIKQDILLEALDTSVLFGVPQAVSVSGDFMTVQSDSMGVLYLPFPSSGRVQYSVRSQTPRILPGDASAAVVTYPEFVRRQYLQLPALGPEIARLSSDVTHRSRSSYESVLFIKQHLLENYRYSLEMESGRSPHPLEDFLFTRKTGYCEHYATAMVVMLRSVGIPARLVTGFLATEWNGFGHYYTVRQRDAHAWVEVYFPGSGWITFDPTPPEPASATTPWWRSLDGAVDSVRLRWDQLIIQYSAADQLSVIQGVRDSSDALRNRFTEAMALSLDRLLRPIKKGFAIFTDTNLREAGLMVLMIGSGFVILVLLAKTVSVRKPKSFSDSPGHLIAAQWYGQLLSVTAARGFQKPLSHTPMEFARHVEQHWAEGSPYIRQLTQLYCRVRFGRTPVTQEDLQAAAALLRELGDMSKSAR